MKPVIIYIAMALSAGMLTSCEKYLNNTQLPSGTIAGEDAYVSDNSVSAIVTGNFLNLTTNGAFANATGSNLPYLLGLYTDELTSVASTNAYALAFYVNGISTATTTHWSSFYSKIYGINAAIEGINNASVTLYYKNQWLGESYFTRAFLYFYLTNLYGDAPLALTTDYRVNQSLPRAPQSQVYQQIVNDLLQAQSLLSMDYKDGYASKTTPRVRPNKAVANALLAKVYLYMKDWKNAEKQASSVLDSTGTYKLSPLSQVFIADNAANKETIWALATKNDEKAYDYGFYNNGMPATITKDPLNGYTVLVALSDSLRYTFEAGDARYTNWVRNSVYTGGATPFTYYFPDKYKSNTVGAERMVMLRLAELYLVRAEARAQQENISGAQADLNAVRLRASLQETTANNRDELLTAIAHERRVELFTEFGNRFFDLKRTGAIDDRMKIMAPLKGGTWEHYKQLFPIPESDMRLNPALTPNPGY